MDRNCGAFVESGFDFTELLPIPLASCATKVAAKLLQRQVLIKLVVRLLTARFGSSASA
jgi:hypothetical protein